MAKLKPADIRAFVERDRTRVTDAKTSYWVERKRTLGPAEGIRIANELRMQVLALHPEWPSVQEQADDLATHERVAKALGAVRIPR